MVLLRRVIGDALRTRRQAQHRTLREVSTAANVSLGYLSEIERGQKEPSSELLSAICEALGAHLSELLRDVSHSVEHAERGAAVPANGAPVNGAPANGAPANGVPAERTRVPANAVPAGRYPDEGAAPAPAVPTDPAHQPAPAAARLAGAARSGAATAKAAAARRVLTTTVDGDLAVTVRQDGPLRATLSATRTLRTDRDRGRDALAPV